MERLIRFLGIITVGAIAGYFAGKRVFPYEPYALVGPDFIFATIGSIIGPILFSVGMVIFRRIENERDQESRKLRMMYAVVCGSVTTFLAVLALAYWWKYG